MAQEARINIKADGKQASKSIKEIKQDLEGAKGAGQGVESSIEGVGNESLTVRQRLKQLKDEMAAIGNVGSPRFQQLAAEAGKLKDQMNNANAAIKAMSSDFGRLQVGIQAFQGIGAAASFAAGAQLLVGEENKELAKTFQRLIALQTMMTSVQQIANSLSDEAALGIALRTKYQKLFNKEVLASAVATGTATNAQKVMNVVMKANPLIRIVGIITAVIAGLVALAKNVKAVGDFFVWMGDMAQDAMNAVLMFFGVTDEAIETQGRKERRLQEERRIADAEQKKAHASRMREIKERVKAETEAIDETISALEVQKDTLEAEGKASDDVTIKILEAELAKTEAVLQGNKDRIESWTTYYKNLAQLNGQSEEEFIESMKNRGVDLLALQDEANKLLEKNEQQVQLAENRITKFKREQNEQRTADAKKQQEEEEKIRQAAYQAELDRLHDLQKEQNDFYNRLEKVTNDFYDSQLTAQQREENAVRDKYFTLIAEAEQYGLDIAELERMRQEELDAIEREYEQKRIERRDAERQQLKDLKEQDAADREQAIQDTINKAQETADTLFSIADSSQQLLHGKELKRAKEKIARGERLTKHEEKLIRREEALRKAQAIAQIASDTARGVSGAIAAGAGVPFPGNLFAIATGIASVLAGIAQASQVLGESSGIPSVSDVTESQSTDETIQNTPNINQVQSGSTIFGNQKVFVVESDITDTQNQVAVTQSQAQFS